MSEKLFEIAQAQSGSFYMSDMFQNFEREDAMRFFPGRGWRITLWRNGTACWTTF